MKQPPAVESSSMISMIIPKSKSIFYYMLYGYIYIIVYIIIYIIQDFPALPIW
jgi:hypothetical protein